MRSDRYYFRQLENRRGITLAVLLRRAGIASLVLLVLLSFARYVWESWGHEWDQTVMESLAIGDGGYAKDYEGYWDANMRDRHGSTPLMYAAEWGNGEVVGSALSMGARVNDRDPRGRTALSRAASEKGTRPPPGGDRAVATHQDYEEVVRLLLSYGAAINMRDNEGKTALRWAKDHGRTGMAALLSEHGARE